MKNLNSHSVVLRGLSVATLAVAVLATPVLAQQGSLARSIEGTWTLQSIYNEVDGKKTDVFGPNPKGLMILTPSGRFTITIMKASLPTFASNNRVKGTAEEYQAVVQGSVAYFGTYSVLSEKDKTVSMRIEASTFPNYTGQEQKRVMSVAGDEMNLTNPVAGVGGTNYLVWKRTK
jgi:hypothetical protein